MFDDIESDFWKEKLNDIQHKNMTRPGAERLVFSDVTSEIKKFEDSHSGLAARTTDNTTYKTWEIPVTSKVKLRIFFQSQIKVSLMEVSGGDPVKICDAKFPYNPFPEIDVFVNQISQYRKELDELMKEHMKISKKQMISGEFIKAYVQAKIPGEKYIWQVLPENECFFLKLTDIKTSEERTVKLSMENFRLEIEDILK